MLRKAALVAVFALLVASLGAYLSIPFWSTGWGIDLANLTQFHQCSARNDPYAATGVSCGDPTRRDMLYPPLMYWAFVWTRLVDFKLALYIWSAAILIILVLVRRAWLAPADRARFWPEAFWLLLCAQYPVAFALERGNCDAWVLALWAGAVVFHVRDRPLVSGAFAGAAIAAKLYPIFAVFVVFVGHPRRARFAAGVAAAGAVALALFPVQTWTYVTVQLPEAANLHPAAFRFGHVLDAQPLLAGWPGRALQAALLVVWGAAAARRLGRDPLPCFAGALAISTYFQRTSWDYNLITTYPLLLVLFVGLCSGGRLWGARWGLLLLGLAAIVTDRGLIVANHLVTALVLAQVVWLLATALFVALLDTTGDALSP